MSDKNSKQRPRCCESVREPGPWPRFHQCARAGVVEFDGRFYCKTHSPEARKAREDAQYAKYKERRAALSRNFACLQACDGMFDPVAEIGALKKVAETARTSLLSEGDSRPVYDALAELERTKGTT